MLIDPINWLAETPEVINFALVIFYRTKKRGLKVPAWQH